MIYRGHALPLSAQARQLGISRGSIYYLPRPVSDSDLTIMRRIDELHLLYPFAGSRMLRDRGGKSRPRRRPCPGSDDIKAQHDIQAQTRLTSMRLDDLHKPAAGSAAPTNPGLM